MHQGSVLDQLLFPVFINDVANNMTDFGRLFTKNLLSWATRIIAIVQLRISSIGYDLRMSVRLGFTPSFVFCFYKMVKD